MTDEQRGQMSSESAEISPIPSVGPKAAGGAVWTMSLTLAHRAVNFVKIIIVARLLTPRDFGLMGVAILSISLLETFSKTGFEAALIQKKRDYTEYLDTAWSMELVRAFALAALLVLGAPLIAVFFGESEATAVVRVTAAVVVLKVLVNPMVVSLIRDLHFRQLFFINTSGLITGAVTTVLLALTLRNVWALVLGSITGATTTLIVSYLILPYRPRFRIQGAQVKELFGYGKWVLASFILRFLTSEGDDVLVGGLLGITMLGYYQMAYRISHAPVTQFTNSLFNVFFPAYAKLKEDLPRLRNAYTEVLTITCLLTVPIMFAVILLAEDFTLVVLGRKWLPIVEPMQILCVAGVVKAIGGTADAVFYALGKPKLDTKWRVVQLTILAALIIPLIHRWGLSGAAGAVLAGTLPSVAGYMRALTREAQLKWAPVLRALLFPAACSSFMSICAYWMYRMPIDMSDMMRFSLAVAGAIGSYLTSVVILDHVTGFGARKLFLHRVGHILGK